MKIKIIIAAHKPYWMPEDNIYVPVQVGAFGKNSIGFTRDDTRDNISLKNPYYNELTGLYWGWKNIDCDCIGLVHYRRHFCLNGKRKLMENILNGTEAEQLLSNNDIIVPKKRNYRIETLESHFNHVKLSLDSDLPMLRSAIDKVSPEYLDSFDRCIKRTWGHMFNMFVMNKDYADKYCEWLFAVLGELEKTIDTSQKIHPARRRIIGYLAEFMLDIWLDKTKYPYKEIDTVFLEKQNEVKKIFKFFIRKFRR